MECGMSDAHTTWAAAESFPVTVWGPFWGTVEKQVVTEKGEHQPCDYFVAAALIQPFPEHTIITVFQVQDPVTLKNSFHL